MSSRYTVIPADNNAEYYETNDIVFYPIINGNIFQGILVERTIYSKDTSYLIPYTAITAIKTLNVSIEDKPKEIK